MAKTIIDALGPHKSYFEPFCGSMAVLLSKPAARYETVSDLYGRLTNLAQCLAEPDQARELYARTSATLFSESLFSEAIKRQHEPGVEGAYWYFVACWMGRNGAAGMADVRGGSNSLAVRWTANGGSSTTRWRSAVDSIPAWHERLRNVVILNRDGFEVIDRIPDEEGAAVYVDPPYFAVSRTGWHGGQSRYEHEFEQEATLFGTSDHERLRDALARFERACVVISYYDCEELRRLYTAPWTIEEHTTKKNLNHGNYRDSVANVAPEVLITNSRKVT